MVRRIEEIAVPYLEDLLQEDLLLTLSCRDLLAADKCFFLFYLIRLASG